MVPAADAKHYVLVCGPPGFSETARDILNEKNYKYRTFLGMPNKYPEVPTNWLGRVHRQNPYAIYWAVTLTIMAIIWSFSRGQIGFAGRFCVEGFTNEKNVTRYAYRLVTDPAWSNGSEPPEDGCNADPLIG